MLLTMKQILLGGCLTLLILAGACRRDLNRAVDTNAADSTALVFMMRTPCFGECPHYEATFYDNGTLIYEGHRHVPVLGRYRYQVSPEEIEAILTRARQIGYADMEAQYLSLAQDLPTTISRINFHGEEKEIQAVEGEPADLRRFHRQLHEQIMEKVQATRGDSLPGTPY